MQLCLSSLLLCPLLLPVFPECQDSPKPWNHRRQKRRMQYDRSGFYDVGIPGGFRACQGNLGEMSGEIPPCVAEAA